MFYEKLRNKVVCNLKLFKNDKGVSSFVDELGDLHFQNESYHNVVSCLKSIHAKYPNYPQKDGLITMTSLGWSFFNYLADSTKGFAKGKSFMSSNVQAIFTNNREWFQTSSKKGWFQMPTPNAPLLAIDDNKHYTSCMLSAINGWVVFNIMDEIEPYDGDDLTPGFYYVESTDRELLAGNDWYCEERVDLALFDKIINESQIKYQIRAQESLPADYFHHFIKEVYALFGTDAKEAWNAVAGYFGRWKKSTQKHYFTQSLEVALGEIATSDNVVMSRILARDLEDNYLDYDPLRDRDLPDNERMERFCKMLENAKAEQDPARDDIIAYEMTFKNSAVFDSNYLPIHKKIYDMSAIKMYKLRKEVGGTLLYQHCDTIVVEKSGFNKFGVGIGLPRKVNQIPEFDVLLSPMAFVNEKVYDHVIPTWTDIDSTEFEKDEESAEDEIKYLIAKDHGLSLQGEGGTGKSNFVKLFQRVLKELGIKYESCAPTGSAASLIYGITIHRLLGMSNEGEFT